MFHIFEKVLFRYHLNDFKTENFQNLLTWVGQHVSSTVTGLIFRSVDLLLVDLRMRPVTVLEMHCPTHVKKFLKFVVFKFSSRIVVNKLSGIEKVHFRKWETYCIKHSTCKADIQFLETYSANLFVVEVHLILSIR